MIELINVSLRRGGFVLPENSLAIPRGKCGLLTGAAGAGKTSLVEAVCGLQEIESGQLRLRGEIANEVPMVERGIGYLPQDVALFPHMTIRQNVAFGPRVQGWSKQEVVERVDQLAKKLDLTELLRRMPHQLSGGQQKRVAMARAVALRPDIVCLDEPFVSLDERSRELVGGLLREMLKDQAATVLVVTHQPQWMEGLADVEFSI